MKNTWALRIPAVFVFIVFAAASVFGQAVNNAQIHGRVTDAGGAAVAKALVKVTQTASGLVRTATSDSEGGYSLPYLPVGPYQLEVSAQGFQDYIQKGIILQVGQDVQVDVSLPTGGVSEKIEVDANAEMVETRETSVSTVIDQRRIVDLPLNGRQATQLILLSGAATNPPLTGNDLLSSKNYGNGLNNSSVAISVAGGQETSTSYLLDGGDHNDAFSNVNLPVPFPDALQAVFGDWQLSGILTHYSGSWFSVLRGNDNSLSGIGKDRPNVVGNPNVSNPTVQQWFNTKAFAANAPGTFGNSGRDILEGPGFFTLDPALSRNFRIRERQMLQLRWEAFNALNHPNFNNPVATFTSSQFGQITSTGDPRVMQIALKYMF